ncbi:MarR family winged helix-turn-helix transcriptional regulator [uncultured Anaerococcus sp.]|uniref:MarR family winged helix-turn-helix transcriptional regulator n=1 Tax=uncultured Anaerococcus sp. TaxID=293428 RepID=UPI002634744F|nr:MarR family transcriptional regulator [uncultured Anaerococcus sp.]
MKDNILEDIVKKTKLHFYRSIFKKYENSNTSLTFVETMLLEVIDYLEEPTINELVNFLYISQPNMSYKINILEKKGYVQKVKSDKDGRFSHIILTDKYYDYKNRKSEFTKSVLERVEEGLDEHGKRHLYLNLELVDKELEKKLEEFINSKDI